MLTVLSMLRSGAGQGSIEVGVRLQVRPGGVQGTRSDMAETASARPQAPTTLRANREGAKAIHAAHCCTGTRISI
eukprot:2969072-Lingulodinium_polyedra.AAC.1